MTYSAQVKEKKKIQIKDKKEIGNSKENVRRMSNQKLLDQSVYGVRNLKVGKSL